MEKDRDEKFLKDHGCTTWGDYNHPPLPYKKCDISKFWGKYSSYGIRDDEFRQVHLEEKYPENVNILIYHDLILMIKVKLNHTPTGYEYIPTCYVVGCDHEFMHKSDIRGNAEATCRICGYSYKYDCSD
jgi:hypothetical protein